ncbi:MAG: DUF1731 domain-containing protein [Bdellovibrionales bacterium]|nr:DUF1731 domain-containing protein [Bdellovibrionales bacterium]
MKIVIPGGTGSLGRLLAKSDLFREHDLVVLSRGGRRSNQVRMVPWDGQTLGEWAREMDGADIVINLSGQSVKCLYTDKNLKTLKDSRVKSTQVIGQAIRQAKKPPTLWIQMSSTAIYTHRFDAPNDEESGQIGESPNIPVVWKHIVQLVKDWEEALYSSQTDHTRKIAIRSGVVMDLTPGGAFDIFLKLSRFGLGGNIAGGKQMVSWIHKSDFINAIHFLIQNNTITGPVNMCSPYPVSQGEFMKTLRKTVGAKWGLPATKWMIELSSYFIGIDSELSLKSRYVIPKVLMDKQYSFLFPEWSSAAKDLYAQWKVKKDHDSHKNT